MHGRFHTSSDDLAQFGLYGIIAIQIIQARPCQPQLQRDVQYPPYDLPDLKTDLPPLEGPISIMLISAANGSSYPLGA